jgi:hypothetical protein
MDYQSRGFSVDPVALVLTLAILAALIFAIVVLVRRRGRRTRG